MLEFIFWKVSPKGRAFTFMGVPLMAVAAVVIITGGVVAVVMAVNVVTAVVIAPGKGSGKNPEKSSLRRKEGLPSGLLTQKGARMGVTGAPLNISPAQKE